MFQSPKPGKGAEKTDEEAADQLPAPVSPVTR
jgi:hypothetical protein